MHKLVSWSWQRTESPAHKKMGMAAEIAGGKSTNGTVQAVQDEQGWTQTTLLFPCQLCLPGKSHVAHVVVNYKILFVTSSLFNKARTDSNLTLIYGSNTVITNVEKTALAQEQPLDK